MRMKDVLANKVAEYSSHGYVCRKVLQASDACDRNRGGRAVSKKLHPGLRILVCQHACHRPGQAGMLRRERTVKRIVDPKAAVAGAFQRTLPAGDELGYGIHDEGVPGGRE
jgi:hypothetical protein